MTQEMITTLLRLGHYMALSIWLMLLLVLAIGVFRRHRDMVIRAAKYLINSAVFLLAYVFYIDMALIVRAPGSEPALKEWVAQNVKSYLSISLIAVVVLLAVNLLFYKRVEKHRYKVDLFILTVLDILILVGGAWLSGQDAYYGLLQELNR